MRMFHRTLSDKFYKQYSNGSYAKDTLRQLLRPSSRGHEANFHKILPNTMKKLVADGLFEPCDGTYKITARGRALLKELELKP